MKTTLKSVCAFGDSVMKGIVMDKDLTIPGQIKYKISNNGFATRCRDTLCIEVDNFAKFGGVVSHGMKFVDRYAERIKKSDYVIFEYGGNDCDFNWAAISENPDVEHFSKTPLTEFDRLYRELIEKVKSMGAKPVLLSLPILEPHRFFSHVSKGLNAANILQWLQGSISFINRWHERYNMEIFRLSAAMRVPVIDITSVFLEKRNYADYLCEDGIHPNEAGHQLIEGAILNYMQSQKILA